MEGVNQNKTYSKEEVESLIAKAIVEFKNNIPHFNIQNESPKGKNRYQINLTINKTEDRYLDLLINNVEVVFGGEQVILTQISNLGWEISFYSDLTGLHTMSASRIKAYLNVGSLDIEVIGIKQLE